MPAEPGERLTRDLIQAAIEYELAWNKYSAGEGTESDLILLRAGKHQALLVAIRRYIGDWE